MCRQLVSRVSLSFVVFIDAMALRPTIQKYQINKTAAVLAAASGSQKTHSEVPEIKSAARHIKRQSNSNNNEVTKFMRDEAERERSQLGLLATSICLSSMS